MFIFLHVAWNNRNQTNVFVFLTCMLHDFLEERCVAGGTVFVLICTSPDVASLKGGRVMCEGKFFLAGVNQRCFACLISNKLEIKRQ